MLRYSFITVSWLLAGTDVGEPPLALSDNMSVAWGREGVSAHGAHGPLDPPDCGARLECRASCLFYTLGVFHLTTLPSFVPFTPMSPHLILPYFLSHF